jgi:hypothetical protein
MDFKQWSEEVSVQHWNTSKYRQICWRGINLKYYFSKGFSPTETLEHYLK